MPNRIGGGESHLSSPSPRLLPLRLEQWGFEWKEKTNLRQNLKAEWQIRYESKKHLQGSIFQVPKVLHEKCPFI